MVHSLAVEIVEVDGTFVATAPWLSEPMTGSDANELLARALDARRGQRAA